MKKVKNKLRVVHHAQIPCKPFIVEVEDEKQALFIMDTLAKQHLFLFHNRIIPDYSNAIYVEMWDETFNNAGLAEWVDYYNEEEGMDFDEITDTYLSNN